MPVDESAFACAPVSVGGASAAIRDVPRGRLAAEAAPTPATDDGITRKSGTPIVIGLVLTLAAAGTDSPPLLAGLRARPGLRLGAQSGHWLPVTAETDDPRELHRWLDALPGVRAVDVVFVEVLPETADPAALAAGHAANEALPGRAGTAIE